jgi:hypothetical protein
MLLFVGLYRFITRVVFPLLRITNAVRGQMKNMQQSAAAGTPTSTPKPEHKVRKGDYIEFEEVR